MGCRPRLPHGQGTRLSPRIVDDAASGSPRARAWTRRRAHLPGQAGSGHGVQDPQRARGEAAQSALLPRTPRSGVQAEDGGGSVRLSRGEAHQGDSGGGKTRAKRCGGDCLLRREARHPGDRNDGAGLAARARQTCGLGARSRVQAPRHGQLAGRRRSSSPARSTPSSRTVTARANSSNSSRSSTPPIRAIPRSS
jgi:hypothetical protein